MSLLERIKRDMISAMKEKKEQELLVLRMLASAIKNKEIEKRSSGKDTFLNDEETIAVIRSEIKKRKDAEEQFLKGERKDLAEKESHEKTVLMRYMPDEMSDEELETMIRAAVASRGASVPGDFGRVMSEVMKEAGGRVSGERASACVRKILSGPHT